MNEIARKEVRRHTKVNVKNVSMGSASLIIKQS